MDPISLIVTALVAGLSTGVTDTAKTAVVDIYTALKARLKIVVEGSQDAKEALAAVEKKPTSEGHQITLKEELTELKVNLDSELIALAKSLLEMLDDAGAKSGKYNISIQNARGTVIGDHSTVTQHITDKSNSKK